VESAWIGLDGAWIEVGWCVSAHHKKKTKEKPQKSQNMWFQTVVSLQPKPRGCHLVTREVLTAETQQHLQKLKVGIMNVFVQHTSCSLSINENCDPDVRKDMSMVLDKLVPENLNYLHTDEGPDDMPSHVKSALMGVSLNIPVGNGKLALGTWQGIYLNEHRDRGGSRRIVLTLQGE